VALAEMSFNNSIGFDVSVETRARQDKALFSETGGFVLEVPKSSLSDVETILEKYSCDYSIIGKTNSSGRIQINNVIDIDIETAKHAWINGLRDKLL
jgi:phosphoribosylformylglycinamidine synthase